MTEGLQLVRELVEKAGDRIIIMPGSGINSKNIKEIAIQTGAREFHLSARTKVNSRMTFARRGTSMGLPGSDEYSLLVTDAGELNIIKEILSGI